METTENSYFIADIPFPTVIPAGSQGRLKRQSERDGVAFKRQLFATLGAIVGSISFGMTSGFSATLLPQLGRLHSFVENESSESWIASSVVLSMLLGVIITSASMRYWGRKKAQIYLYLPWMWGWIWISLATNFWNLLAGCVFVGIGAGGHSVVSFLYVGEISDPRFRGLISTMISVGIASGIMLSHVQGIFLPWRVALRISFCLPLLAGLLALFIPESPTWLALRGREEEAKEMYMWLRNDAPESEKELRILISKAIKYNRKSEGFIREIFSKSFLKPFFILKIIFVVQQGSGLNVMIFYIVKIFEAMSDNVDANTATIVADTVRLIAMLVSCVLVKVTERRKLYFLSVFGLVFSLMGMIASVEFHNSSKALVVFTCSYIWFLYIGVSPIPWIMMGELYPANLKEFGTCMSNFVAFFVMFIVVKTAPFIIMHLGMTAMFAIYSVVVVIGAIILYFIMPETNNITLQEVEEKMIN